MRRKPMKQMRFGLVVISLLFASAQAQNSSTADRGTVLTLRSNRLQNGSLALDRVFYETKSGRVMLPAKLSASVDHKSWSSESKMADGRTITVAVEANGKNFNLQLRAQPNSDIIKWGMTVDSRSDEYYTGLMERVVDGPQAAS